MINDPTCCGADIARLKAQLDGSNAERQNMYPLLSAAERKNATYARELELTIRELDRMRDAFTEADLRCEELEHENRELNTDIRRLTQAIANATATRDALITEFK